jgi:Pvc16 N-terminal domain
MALLDVSKVTSTLMTLLDTHVNESPAWPSSVTLNVTAEPPDQLDGDATLGVYLYHLNEDSHHRNLPAADGNGTPVRFTPMGLSLHYQVTPHSDLDGGASALREQLIMGCAVKALHDFPVVDDATEIAGTPILDPALAGAGNRLRITLQPLPYGDVPSFWTAESQPLRLAAYYEVSVVLLEPDEPPSRAGRVLRYGVFAFPAESPRLVGSRSTIVFSAPGEADPRELEARPAQVPVGGTLVLEGSALAGDRVELVLRSARWDDPVVPDPEAAGWNLVATPTRMTASVQATAGPEDVLPGVYGASLRVVRRREVPDGGSREFEHRSNEMPFVVVPAIDSVAVAAGVATVTGGPFEHADIPVENVEISVGEARLTRSAAAAPAAGEFVVDDAATMRIGLPAGLVPGSAHPLRVIVNRAESEPRWVTAP